MKLLKKAIHPDVGDLTNKSVFKRLSTRAIVLDQSEILLLYTKRYDDYSLPGGGIDAGESFEKGLIRELQEETGAKNIKIQKEFGIYELCRARFLQDLALSATSDNKKLTQ